MKNKKIVLLIILICSMVLSAAILFMWNYPGDYNTTLEVNWEITIPSEAQYSEIYRKDSDSSFHGDGIRYHVFSYEEHSYISAMLDWESEERETIFYANYSDAVNGLLDAIEVPSEYRPYCSDCLFWYESQSDNSEIIILWDKGNSTIYVVESFL